MGKLLGLARGIYEEVLFGEEPFWSLCIWLLLRERQRKRCVGNQVEC